MEVFLLLHFTNPLQTVLIFVEKNAMDTEILYFNVGLAEFLSTHGPKTNRMFFNESNTTTLFISFFV